MRLAVALVCVGVSLILGSYWTGFAPDIRESEMRGRVKQCEAIGLNAAALIRRENWSDLESILDVTASRDDGLLSIGVRDNTGTLLCDTDHHGDTWDQGYSKTSGVLNLEVPIRVHGEDWGRVEFCYRTHPGTLWGSLSSHPMSRMLLFFVVVGTISYTVFVSRIMRVFDSTQVVPDRVRQALDTLAEGLLVLNERERIILANQAFADTVGIDRDKLAGQTASQLDWVGVDGNQSKEYPWLIALQRGEAQTDHHLRYRRSDGSFRIFSINTSPIAAANGKNRGTLATFRDVTIIEENRAELERMLDVLQANRDEIKRKNQELEILATQDALTGCLNRRAFFERFERKWSESEENHQPLSCIMIDNDHFKQVNDTYGHHTGDEVLRAVSGLLKRALGDLGLVCRYGGEEFCIVLPGFGVQQAAQLAEGVRELIQQVRLDSPKELRISASIGVSDLSFEPTDPQDLINQADLCLYVAKRQGRNRVVVFDPSYADAPVSPEEKVQRSEMEGDVSLPSIPFQAVTALVSALAYRDAETAEHSRRVSDLCVAMAKGLLDQKETYILEIAALLHDIGKVGVPDEILLKPDRLTPDEWVIMGQHDRIGVEIIAGTFGCDSLSEIVRTHHSHFAGKHHAPHLPQGEEIPLAARILTICDSYDAITSDRPYRRARSHGAAIEELRRCAGTQFDPQLVEHFATITAEQSNLSKSMSPNIPQSIAWQIGTQIERLSRAVDERDAKSLNALASRLSKIARRHNIESIALAAELLEVESTSKDLEWVQLLETTLQLLELCRFAQLNSLIDTRATDAWNHAKATPQANQR